ncbi:4'-phosphopantetheinyl transferase family protein [Lewinella sp. IMCC34191]|uniref:4'-phosphopantetheinyl transferase family protein n=1 Tax=Lewinella sp. IMCC34191 TaxID=2259172 RepID=UPI000E24185E|nr:4'-phosphopantetheinyl transferase superfamily protein [Lewinella sp. IMCC34191]
MIELLTQANDNRIPPAEWQRLLGKLPPDLREAVARYRRWQDRQATVLGKLLACRIAETATGEQPSLSDLRADEYRRPYWPQLPDFDFNISHTAGMVICCGAVGAGRVGIDVERVGEVDVTEFRRVFTEAEYGYLTSLADPASEFYRLWTRKEAVMKADGRGFYLDPSGIDCLAERVRIDGDLYTVRSLELGLNYAAHLAKRDRA